MMYGTVAVAHPVRGAGYRIRTGDLQLGKFRTRRGMTS